MIVTIGVIARAHGVKGEVVIDVRTDSPDKRFTENAVIMTDPPNVGPVTLTHVRPHGDRLLVRFKEIPDRTAAEAARGVRLLTEIADDAVTEDPDEYFDHQLIGLGAELLDGQRIGDVADVLHRPGQDLLAIRRDDGGQALVPFVSQIVTSVDISAGRVVIDPPDGLLEIGGAS